MKIILYSSLRTIVGHNSIIIPVAERTSLLDALHLLAGIYPEFQAMVFDEHGNVNSQMPIFLNGRNPRLLPEGLYTIVAQEDILSLFTPIASGKMNVEVLNRAASERAHQENEDEN